MDRRDGRRDGDQRRGSSGRVPPHNLEAEESVLGAVLLSRDAIGAVSEQGLRPEDFYRPGHQHIFDAVRALYSSGAPVDTVTVADELRRAGLLDQVGGTEALHALQNATPAISNAAHYARIVQDTALLRSLIHVAGDIAEIAFGGPDDVTKAVDEAESKVFKVAEQRVTDSTLLLSESIKGVMDRLEETFARGDIITGTATGYNDLDELLSGLQPSTLNIIGARPAMGKTSLGLGMATHVAQTTAKPVLVFSLEMGHNELTQRILSSEAQVESTKMRNGRLSEADWARIGRAIGRLEVPLFLDDNPRVTVMEIRAKARRHEGPLRRPRPHRHRLRPADGRRWHGGEPPARGQRDQPQPEDPRPRAGGADRGPQPAQPQPRVPQRQAPDAVRPTREWLVGAGRRRRDVPVPRRGVQPGVAGQGLGGDHHRQAPLRPDRHQAARLAGPVHPLRQRRSRRLTATSGVPSTGAERVSTVVVAAMLASAAACSGGSRRSRRRSPRRRRRASVH